MAYYSPKEMEQILNEYPQYREQLYCRGFLITNDRQTLGNEYPFYSNWKEQEITQGTYSFYLYTHKLTNSYLYRSNEYTYFLIGHAYDPFRMVMDEIELLKNLAEAMRCGETAFWDAESELTGVFCIGYLANEQIVYSTDCAGMQLVCHGTVNDKIYITSHSKLVADLLGLEQSAYIKKIVSGKFWHYWGTWLPGDLSPYEALKRMQPNCAGHYSMQTKTIYIERYYPLHEVKETTTQEEYEDTIHELGRIMSNTMSCIAQKWPDKKVSVSVTGGRDSMTTLACAKDHYDKFSYFSYVSNEDEAVDAAAAKKILYHLGLKHELYEIPEEYEEYQNMDAFKKVMMCNAGCIGENNANDLRKRMYFIKHPPCDIEVKSWVGEMGRAYYYSKYNKKKFPKYPNAKYWRVMHKLYLHPQVIRDTNRVFEEYLNQYYSKEIFDRISWLELYFWEFSWGGAQATFLTSEHRVSYDITVPFNNRKYIEKMLTVPLEKRKRDAIPNDLIAYMEPRIAETGIVIKDVSHTNFRAFIIRKYLEIFSKL